MDRSYFQSFDQVKFTDIYPNFQSFKSDYMGNDNFINGIPKLIKDENLETLYYLLYAKHANSIVANYDTNQFKYGLFSTIWQYGPTWQKRLEIQAKLRELSLDDDSDIYKGSKAIYNSADNPSNSPSTASLEELNYINHQNTTQYKKSKLDGLALLNDLIETDVTRAFLDKFKKLFRVVIYSGRTLLYETEGN